MILSPFLKRVLLLDAASCLGMGLLLSFSAAPLSGLFGLPEPILRGAGLALLPIGLFVLWLGTRRAAAPALVWLLIAGNLLWTAESLVLAGSSGTITAAGTAFVTAQAAAVAMLTLLEWVGLRGSRAASRA